jgi:hypothetical protein
MKLGSACLQCRNAKRKCDKSRPGTACEQCLKRHLQCSSVKTRPGTPATLLPSSLPLVDQSQIPSDDIASELIELYITYIHDKPHSLFHEPSLRNGARNKTLHYGILYGIFGLTAR